MNKTIDLTPLFPLQAALDERIQSEHHVNYGETTRKRILALLVELGEFANETRCFKFWSSKAPSSKEVILDEYADCIHFLLSLGIVLGIKSFVYDIKPCNDLTEKILETYHQTAGLIDDFSADNYTKAFSSFLDIIYILGVSTDEVIGAYKKKLGVNYKRQDSNY